MEDLMMFFEVLDEVRELLRIEERYSQLDGVGFYIGRGVRRITIKGILKRENAEAMVSILAKAFVDRFRFEVSVGPLYHNVNLYFED
jgi:hypothetical protein